MTALILTLAIAYALVLLVATLAVLSSDVPLPLRGALAIAVPVLLFVTYDGIGKLRGLPSDSAPPDRFRLHWAEMREPDKLTGETGYVFLWITELDENWYIIGQPRAHRLPWSEDLADMVDAALVQIAEGEEIAGEITETIEITDTAERLAEDLEAADGHGGGTAVGERYINFDFGDLGFGAAEAPVTPEKRD